MLTKLVIKNYALIQELKIKPNAGLNMVTGETGAGKSIMLGAIGLLLGNRADSKSLYDEEKKCVIEGEFDLSTYNLKSLFSVLDVEYDKQTIIRRELSPSGKSRSFINDQPVTLDVLKKIGRHLIDIHSQHDTLMLSTEGYQLALLDAFAATDAIKNKYAISYDAYKLAEKEYAKLKKQSQSLKNDLDYNVYLLKELEDAALVGVNQEELESELEVLENIEAIKTDVNSSLDIISNAEYSITNNFKTLVATLGQASAYSPKVGELQQRLESSLIEVQDISYELEKLDESLQHDPARIDVINEKLTAIYHLQQKHKVETVDGLLSLKDSIQAKVDSAVNIDETLITAKNNVELSRDNLINLAKTLSEKRQGVVPSIENHINAMFPSVGMPNASIGFEFLEKEPDEQGIDSVKLLFTANKGIPPKEIGVTASGGEFSRLMLLIKHAMAGRASLPTVIFDEIDTGISGEVALKVCKIMQQMAEQHQVITISHLPQIAAKGNKHFFVYKDNSERKSASKIKVLKGDERVFEIAKMIGGDTPSSTAFENARELIEG